MSEPQKAALPLHPATTLVPWLEDLVHGRRVAVLGDTTIGLVESLVDRGARLVHGYDPDASRAVEAAARGGRVSAPRPVFAALSDDLGIRDGAFDVVVVPDLADLADAADAVRRIRRMLSPTGVAIIASRNPDAPRWLVRAGAVVQSGPSYYDLYDLVSLQFPEVKMLGQAPFVGYAIVDFSADEPEVTVDATLLDEPESPEWYVVVASERRHEVESYALVELPLAAVAAGLAGGEPTTLRRHELEGNRAMLEARSRELELELRRLQEASEASSLAARDRDAIATRLADAERELIAAVGRMREAEARAADTHVRAERLSTELRELDDELRRQRERAARLNKQLEDERRTRPRGVGGTLVTEKPLVQSAPVSESAAVTIRPEGLHDPDKRGRADLVAFAGLEEARNELTRLRLRVAELEEERREVLPPPTIEPATIEPATLDRERIKQRLLDAEARATRAEARVAEREARAAEAERKLVTTLEQREAIEARLAAAEPELAQLRATRGASDARRATAEQSGNEMRIALERAEARAIQLERALTEGARKITDAEKRSEAAEVRATEAFVRAKEATVRATEAGVRATEAGVRATEAGLRTKEADARAKEADARAKVAEVRASEAAAARIALESEQAVLEARATTAEALSRSEGGASAARAQEEEVDRLESALRDRGREISKLRAELREGLRIGKELLQDLGAARVIAPFPPPASGPSSGGVSGSSGPERGTPPNGGARVAQAGANALAATIVAPVAAAPVITTSAPAPVDAGLAERAAKAHADLVGQSLKIAQLEHEVKRLRVPSTPDATMRELERALVLAQEEIADLRLRHASAAPSPSPRAIEQQVLLAQLGAMAGAAVAAPATIG